MGRGHSPMQEEILRILQGFQSEPGPPDEYGHQFVGDMATPTQIIDALGLERTAANRASVSRSLRRVVERGDAQAYGSIIRRQGNGSRYAATKRNGE